MRSLILFFIGLLSASSVLAHSDGLSFEEQKGDILIDIGFGQDLPSAGSTLTYSFDLFNLADPDAYAFEPFTDVHVRIFRDRTELLSRTLSNNGVDVPSLDFPYQEAGDYSMAVSYERNGKERVEAAFAYKVLPAVVAASSSVSSASESVVTDYFLSIRKLAVPIMGGAMAGIATVVFAVRRKKR